MSPARTLKASRMSESETARQLARKQILALYEAIRLGSIHVVNPKPGSTFRPRMELYNNPDSPNIIATFEIPGVKIADLSISVKAGNLLIQGDRRPRYRSNRTHPSLRGQQTESGDMDVDSGTQATQAQAQADAEAEARFFPSQELRYGSFRRALRLPAGVDTSCISASLSDGLLTVSWPRSPVAMNQADQPSISTITAGHSIERPTSSVRAEPHTTASRYSGPN
ncbi:hypothetical protein C8R43DRAFT_1005244 [Mycena crocata]|nr:hypothetical protein C8R43DRAFT_1005244 [Mycena crocata]